MKTTILIFKFWLPVFLWSALIFWLSSIPGLESGLAAKTDFTLRKLAHLTEYGILAALWLRVLTATGIPRRKAFLFAVLFGVAFAVLDEFHQLYVPSREGKIYDVLIDSLGILTGAAIYNLKKFRKK